MFNGRVLKAGIATTIIATSLCAPLAGNAFARGREKPRNERIVRLKSECNRDIAKHLKEYDAVTHSIANSPWLTEDHAAALTAAVAAARAAAVDDRAQMNSASNLEGTRSECRSALSHRQQLKLILKIGRTTQHADRFDAAIETFGTALGNLSEQIDTLETDGADVTELRAILDEIQGELDDASASVGLGDEIIALLDSDDPEAALSEYKQLLESARDTVMGIAESIDALDEAVNPPVEDGDGGDENEGGEQGGGDSI